MTTFTKTALIVAAVLVFAGIAIAAGFFIGQHWNQGFAANYFSTSPNWARGSYANDLCLDGTCTSGNSFQTFGRGMMGRFSSNSGSRGFGGGRGFGMMGGYSGYRTSSGDLLNIDEARTAFEGYLDDLGNDDLEIQEIMVFDQNAYAVIAEESTGLGAMELLVDHDTQAVYPEYGPNRMWNEKYGMMSGVGCGLGFRSNLTGPANSDMEIGLDEAAEIAQAYLDANSDNAELAEEGYTFYGYYTFDYMLDGQMAGMLSVNGNNGQVWPHTWHGQFVEEWELEEHD